MSSAPMLDEATASTIRAALDAVGRGRVDEACRIGESGLAGGGDVVALNALLGTLCCRSGDFSAGARHLQIAHDHRPEDPVIALNLATALAELGHFENALTVANAGNSANDPLMRFERLRGFLHQSLRDFRGAVAAYEQVVDTVSDDWESWNNLGNARRQIGDFEGSVEALKRAVAINPRSAPTRLNLAMALLAAGQADDSEAALKRMAEDFPEDPKPLRELHALLKDQGRDEEALGPIVEAVRRSPSDLELLLGLASHRLLLLDHEGAEHAYREVVRRDPGNALGNLGLAVVFELTNRVDALGSLAGEAEKRGVDEAILNFIRAFALRREKRFDDGLEALATVPEDLEPARRFQLLGQLSEGAGRYDEAWEAFVAMNRIQSDHPSEPIARGKGYRRRLAQQADALSDEWLSQWRPFEPVDDRPSPAFLVGFPRSGTTLLDTLLMGHADVEVLEEEDTLFAAAEQLPGDFEDLPAATSDKINAARARYFEIAGERTPLAPGKLLIDKNPLSMNALPLIRRIFPDAKIVLALRHPCDVVLSCFVTNFRLNNGMSSFLQLDTAAELYDLSFGLFEKSCRLLKPPVRELRYEKLVEDRDGELRPLLEFLGLDWDERVLDHESTARARGHIKTASYAQVVEPIYKRSAGRWQNYREQLEPVLPALTPWVARFGYSL